MAATALIGHTGFVGSNLLRQRAFDACFNSRTIGEIDGRSFGHVVCAGVGAVKWWANQNPEEDRARIESLMRHLDTIQAEAFTLVSTIDIYGDPRGVTEADRPAKEGLHAYGANRLMLEDWVARRFPRHHVVRLPALFGAGLKKNAIYDLLHDHRTGFINGASSFQWYPLARFGNDLEMVWKAGLPLINIATEPLPMQAIRDRFFPGSAIGTEPGLPEAHYDMRTVHAVLFGGAEGYIQSREDVLQWLGRFIAEAAAETGEAV